MQYNELKHMLLELIDVTTEDFDPDVNLVDFGLDSMQVLELMSNWENLGIQVNLTELSECPTLNGWWDLIQRKQGIMP